MKVIKRFTRIGFVVFPLVLLTLSSLVGFSAFNKDQIEVVYDDKMNAAIDYEIEIAYDDGEMDATSNENFPKEIGQGVLFTPPVTPWILTKVKVYGGQWYQNEKFGIEIWDLNKSVLYSSSYNSREYFPHDMFGWALIDIPDIEVQGDFYIGFWQDFEWWEKEIWLGASGDGFYKGHRRSIYLNRTSHDTFHSPFRAWDWMIRAIGYSYNDPLITDIETDRQVYFLGETINMTINITCVKDYTFIVGLDVYGGSLSHSIFYRNVTMRVGQTNLYTLSQKIPADFFWTIGEKTFKLWVYDPATENLTPRNIVTVRIASRSPGPG